VSNGAIGGPDRKADDEDEHDGRADKAEIEQVMTDEPCAEHGRQSQENADDPQHELSRDFEFHRVNRSTTGTRALDSDQSVSTCFCFQEVDSSWKKVPMPVFTIVVLAVIVAVVTAVAVAVGWAQLHARPANSLSAHNAGRPRRRPF
jgi:hypothetical protein